MNVVPAAAGADPLDPAPRSPKRCVLWLDGTVRRANRALLDVVTATDVRQIVLGEDTLVRHLGIAPLRQHPVAPGMRVRVAVVRTDGLDLAVVIEVLETHHPAGEVRADALWRLRPDRRRRRPPEPPPRRLSERPQGAG
jgi:hypothetical protein